MTLETKKNSHPKESDTAGDTLENVRKALIGLSYGSIEVIQKKGIQ